MSHRCRLLRNPELPDVIYRIIYAYIWTSDDEDYTTLTIEDVEWLSPGLDQNFKNGYFYDACGHYRLDIARYISGRYKIEPCVMQRGGPRSAKQYLTMTAYMDMVAPDLNTLQVPILTAIFGNHPKVVRLLLDNFKFEDYQALFDSNTLKPISTLLLRSKQPPNPDIIRLLLRWIPRQRCLLYLGAPVINDIAAFGSPTTLDVVLDYLELDPDVLQDQQQSWIQSACRHNDVNMLVYLTTKFIYDSGPLEHRQKVDTWQLWAIDNPDPEVMTYLNSLLEDW